MKVRAIVMSLAVLGLATCGVSAPDDTPPQLVEFEIVEGQPSCPGCPLTGARVSPGPDGFLTLRLDALYTARSSIRTGGHNDRCIYRVTGYSWWLPQRDFACTPEQATMVIDDIITTEATLAEHATNPRITAALSEYNTASRTQLSHQDLYEFPVRFFR